MSFSQPEVASLINQAFIPVLLSMHLTGPAADAVGRAFVQQQSPSGSFDLMPPDLFVVGPEREVLGRLKFHASPQETLDLLLEVLRKRPDLAPKEPLEQLLQRPTDPASLALRELEAQYNRTTPDERAWYDRTQSRPDQHKAALIPALERWLAEHAARLPDDAALARVLLGGARYHAGDFSGAREAWESVLRLHAKHPLRHRAEYNLLEPDAFPSLPHPELAHAPRPTVRELGGVRVPDPAVREKNLATVTQDPRYLSLHPSLPFVKIPAGTFTMGGSPAVQARELPTRTVTLTKPFLLSAWPVPRALWRLFRPDAWPGEESEGLAGWLPAEPVSWNDAVAFCEFLSKRDGRLYRLPTEAEWEFAARGGLEGKQYPWGDEDADATRCNFLEPRPVPVACYPPNGYGLFDCVGNNFEWVADYYLKDSYARTPAQVTDPPGPSEAEAVQASGRDLARVARGGGWMGNVMCKISCRNSWRIGWPAHFTWGHLGFRIATDAE